MQSGNSSISLRITVGGAGRVDAAERGCVGSKDAGDVPLACDAVQVVVTWLGIGRACWTRAGGADHVGVQVARQHLSCCVCRVVSRQGLTAHKKNLQQ